MASISGKADPVVRRITANDVIEALGQGLRDFQAMPLYGLTVGAVYAGGGILIVLCITALHMTYLAYPLAAGFALVGPFAAVALYVVSRCREQGETPSLRVIVAAVRARGEIGWMALVAVFMFIMWMYQARMLMALFFGLHASFTTIQQFIAVVLSTSEGMAFLMVGNAEGAVLSLILFSITVVSFPLLLDREVDFVTAMITSVRAVVASPGPMLGWALVIVMLLILSALPFFLGLVVTLPVLGHTTWHLYRHIVEPLPQPAA